MSSPPKAAPFSFGSSAFSTKSPPSFHFSSAPAFNIDLNVEKSSISSRSCSSSSKRRFPSRPRSTNSISPPPIFNPLRHSSTTPAKDDVSTTAHHPVPTPGSTDPAGMNLKILVKKESNQVVFAESGTDFVDLLFSFLTLPIGTILSLLAHATPTTTITGCMNNIFTSVESLDAQLLKTEACKDMLLNPRRSPQVQCTNEILNIEDYLDHHKYFYFCGNIDCREGGSPSLSVFPNVRCKCGRIMDQLATLSGPVGKPSCDQEEREGVFVKSRGEMFLITDDLQVVPGSTSTSIKLLKKLGIKDANELETRNVNVGPEEILQLLRLSLVSKTPLTHWILLKEGVSDLKIELENMSDQFRDKRSKSTSPKKIRLTLIKSKSENKVLYSEAEEDFIDFLFSFLTIPLGSTIKLLDGKSSLGCIDNIYQSVKELGETNYLKSEEHKNMLLAPKLAPFSALENSMFHVDESLHPQYSLNYYVGERVEWRVAPVTNEPNCYPLGKELAKLSVVNPSYSAKAKGTPGGGAFVKGPAKFMVTDSLVVTQLSPISTISFLAKLKVPITDVDEMVVEMGEEEALDLLQAALISGRVLTDVFIEE